MSTFRRWAHVGPIAELVPCSYIRKQDLGPGSISATSYLRSRNTLMNFRTNKLASRQKLGVCVKTINKRQRKRNQISFSLSKQQAQQEKNKRKKVFPDRFLQIDVLKCRSLIKELFSIENKNKIKKKNLWMEISERHIRDGDFRGGRVLKPLRVRQFTSGKSANQRTISTIYIQRAHPVVISLRSNRPLQYSVFLPFQLISRLLLLLKPVWLDT